MTPQIKIGFDAKRAVLNDTGLGNYSRRVIEELSQAEPSWQFVLYSPRWRDGSRASSLLERGNVELALPDGAVWRRLSSLWRVRGGLSRQLRGDGVNLFHGLSNELPLDIHKFGVPSVVTIHDVIYRRCPDNYKAIDRNIYDYKYGRSAKNATRVIAISERTKADIVELYDVDSEKIDVIYQSCSPEFSKPVGEEARARVKRSYGLPDRYIAMVGTLEPRKNQLLAVEAMTKIDPEVHLVIAGRPRQDYGDRIVRRVAELGLEKRVHLIPGVPFVDLPALYAMAELTAYTSRYEGFGLPVVEALSAGTPVIAATGSCLEEAGGRGGVYVHPDDVDGFASEASRLLADATLRTTMVAEGRRHIAEITGDTAASAVLRTYEKAFRAFGAE